MFGGIGGLGFNPMMGPQFGMPMQGFGGQQQQQFIPSQQQFQPQQQNPFQAQYQTPQSQNPLQQYQDQMRASPRGFVAVPEEFQAMEKAGTAFQNVQQQKMKELPEYQAMEQARQSFELSPSFMALKQQELQQQQRQQEKQQFRAQPRMLGGIGGLGFNPNMGPQFGMPMQFNADQMPVMRDMMYRGGPPTLQDRQFRQRREQDMRNVINMVQNQTPAPAPQQPIYEDPGPGYGGPDRGVQPGPIQFSTSRGGMQGPANWDSMTGGQKKSWWESQGLSREDFRKNFSEADTQYAYGGGQQPPQAQQFGNQSYLMQQPQGGMGALPREEIIQGGMGALPRADTITAGTVTGGGQQRHFTGPKMTGKDILNMAVGNMPQDMQYDMNGDGRITSADARAYAVKYGQ
jgi:hypothetical protein